MASSSFCPNFTDYWKEYIVFILAILILVIILITKSISIFIFWIVFGCVMAAAVLYCVYAGFCGSSKEDSHLSASRGAYRGSEESSLLAGNEYFQKDSGGAEHVV
jgi:hypothetical protein